jgi:hypothetical protein
MWAMRSVALLALLTAACGGKSTPAKEGGGTEAVGTMSKVGCAADEAEAFGCELEGGGSLLVCKAEATLHVMVRSDTSKRDGAEAFKLYLYTRALVSYQGLEFQEGDATWFVFSELSSEDGTEESSAGVSRKGADGAEAESRCAGKPRGSLMALDGWIEPIHEYPR